MPELNITSPKDLSKLEGWRIVKASQYPFGIQIVIAHPVTPVKVLLTLHAGTQMQMNNQSYNITPTFQMMSQDYVEESKE